MPKRVERHILLDINSMTTMNNGAALVGGLYKVALDVRVFLHEGTHVYVKWLWEIKLDQMKTACSVFCP